MTRSLVLVLALVLFLFPRPSPAQTRIVTGSVKDSLSGEVVTSGQVTLVGSVLSTTIKDDGTFTLAVPTGGVTLSIRSIGFKKKDVSLPASVNALQVPLTRDYFQ